jgi:large subunit ribosomal protein L25
MSNTLALLPPGLKFTQATPTAGAKREDTSGATASWRKPVVWVGNVKEKKAAGTDILYSGRKRMYKGHKWERTLAAREKQKKILIRDMPARLERFKQVRSLCLVSYLIRLMFAL